MDYGIPKRARHYRSSRAYIHMTNLINELIISFIKKNSVLSSRAVTQIKYHAIYSTKLSNYYLYNEYKLQIPLTHSLADRYFSKTIKRTYDPGIWNSQSSNALDVQ